MSPRPDKTVAGELARLGIRPRVYYHRRQQGLEHEEAIAAALEAPSASRRVGNIHDWSAVSAGELLRGWKSPAG